jgi:hypothetical protein
MLAMNQLRKTPSTDPDAFHPELRFGSPLSFSLRSRGLKEKLTVNQPGKTPSTDPDAFHVVPEGHEVVCVFSGSALEAAN